MKIGDLANLTGTQVETIRYYEKEGLLPEPARTVTNYRIYDVQHVERLAFIRRCRSLDMGLDEVRVLLGLKDKPSQSCEDANRVLDEHLGRVRLLCPKPRTRSSLGGWVLCHQSQAPTRSHL